MPMQDGDSIVVKGTCLMAKASTDCTKKDGGTYRGCKIMYEDRKGEARSEQIHEKAFGFIDGGQDFVEGLQPGDKFSMLKVKRGDYTNVKKFGKGWDSLEAMDKPHVAASQAAPAVGGYSAPARNQNSIVYQSSRKDALHLVEIALANGALKLPAIKSGAFDTLQEIVGKLTDEFAFAAINPEIKAPVSDNDDGSPKAPAAAATSDEDFD